MLSTAGADVLALVGLIVVAFSGILAGATIRAVRRQRFTLRGLLSDALTAVIVALIATAGFTWIDSARGQLQPRALPIWAIAIAAVAWREALVRRRA